MIKEGTVKGRKVENGSIPVVSAGASGSREASRTIVVAFSATGAGCSAVALGADEVEGGAVSAR